MFVGHYAAAFALKGKEKSASLGMLFIATQLVDIVFFPFVLAGIEKLEFVKGFTAVNDFNMYYYPFTHGLLGSLLWALLAFALYYFFSKNNATKVSLAIVMALGVLSHWFTDLLVHTPDLPLITGDPKLGFGLWNNKAATFGLEAVLVLASIYYYLSKTTATKSAGKYAAWAYGAFLILVNYLNLYVLPANHDIVGLTVSALFFYFLFGGIAHWVDTKRT
jgi:uncharacterized membrane protein YwzB